MTDLMRSDTKNVLNLLLLHLSTDGDRILIGVRMLAEMSSSEKALNEIDDERSIVSEKWFMLCVWNVCLYLAGWLSWAPFAWSCGILQLYACEIRFLWEQCQRKTGTLELWDCIFMWIEVARIDSPEMWLANIQKEHNIRLCGTGLTRNAVIITCWLLYSRYPCCISESRSVLCK